MKNKEEIEKYILDNKTFNLNVVLKYNGNTKISLNLISSKIKKKILFIGDFVSEKIETITLEELQKLTTKEIVKKIHRKVLVTTSNNILFFNKKILVPINKARKIKTIKILSEKPTLENILSVVKENKITVGKKHLSICLGSSLTVEKLQLVFKNLNEQIKTFLKKYGAKYYLYATFNKSCLILL